MRHSAILRATTENALAFMQTVGLERARHFPSLTKEPDRARRWLIKLALMRMTTELTMPDGAYPALPVLDWLSSFDNAVHPALLDAIAQAAAAVLTPARATELGHQLVTSAAEAFARKSFDRPSWRATNARASSDGRQRSADTARHARAGGNINVDDAGAAKHARSRSVPPDRTACVPGASSNMPAEVIDPMAIPPPPGLEDMRLTPDPPAAESVGPISYETDYYTW